jgi:catechol 2,3-dioxygenase-like lactoylglutathione lyase family enzyme
MTSIGIRHVHLLVAEHDRAITFYRDVFGMEERFRDGPVVFLGTPDGGDSLALHLATTDDERARIGQQGGWEHFGIHLPPRASTLRCSGWMRPEGSYSREANTRQACPTRT